jgi:N-acetylglucosamine kinase-like BadF-type ATPase
VGKIVAEIIPGEIEVVGDMEIALAAAFGKGPGVIVVAGTGSIVFGRDAQGKVARAGGLGFTVSDEGSAHWIGLAAVRAVLRAADEAGEDQAERDPAWRARRLFSELKTAWSLTSLPQLARAANATPDFAVLFPAVLAAAEAGDIVARQVMADASRELAQLAGIVLRRLFSARLLPARLSPAQDASAVPMAMAGGVFRHAAMIRELFYNEVCGASPDVVLNPEVVDPVQGALQMARKAG